MPPQAQLPQTVLTVAPVEQDWLTIGVDATVRTVFTVTQDASNWVIRTSTRDPSRSVSDETVVGIIVSAGLALLFSVIGLTLNGLGKVVRRAFSSAKAQS